MTVDTGQMDVDPDLVNSGYRMNEKERFNKQTMSENGGLQSENCGLQSYNEL